MLNLRMRFEDTFQTKQRIIMLLVLSACVSALLGSLIALQGIFMPIVSLVVVILVLLAFAWPETATLAVVFALYTNLLVVASKFHGVPQVVASAFLAVLAVPLANYIIFKRESFVITPALPILILYFFVMVLSGIVSQTIGSAFDWLSTFLVEGLFLYFLITNTVRTSATLRRVIWILLIAGSFMGALSIFQEATHSYTNNYWGFAQVDNGGFKVGDDINGSVYRLRLAGPIGEKNRYAQVMLVLFPLALFRFWGEKSRILRVLALASTVLIISGVLLTFSRGAAVAAIGLLAIMTLWGYIRAHQLVVILAICTALILVVAPDFIIRLNSLQGLESVFSDESEGPAADGAIVGRETSNLAAFNAFLDHPALGVGPGQYFEQYSAKYANALGLRFFSYNRRAHNMYLETAADLGAIGLSALLAIFGVTVVNLERLRRYWSVRKPELANMVSAFLLSVISYMATAVFLHLSYLRFLTVTLALANAAIYVFRREAAAYEEAEAAKVSDGAAIQAESTPSGAA